MGRVRAFARGAVSRAGSLRFGESALRASLRASPVGAIVLIVLGLAASWSLTYLLGGADHVVPHWYYVPILLAAVRFGPLAALVVALLSGALAGPLTYLDVAAQISQDSSRWITRSAFFVVIGVGMAGLVRPSLPSIAEELGLRREGRILRQALERGEFVLRYQPIVDPLTRSLRGVEALLRWQRPGVGEVGPAAFLGTAERTDVIHGLGAFVLAEACRSAVRWRDLAASVGRPPVNVAVNMSARELESPDLVERVRLTVSAAGLEPGLLCIEITESVLAQDLEQSVDRLAELQELGIHLAVDDFGTGYSSLSSVHRFPIDVLKIDRSFISTIGREGEAGALLGGLVLFARSVDLTTVAEGVETEQQAELVAELGYDLAQGYHYAHPLPEDAIDALVTAPGGSVARG